MRFATPELSQPDGPEKFSPSWRRDHAFISDEHERIYDQTRDLPGWQHVEDSRKLYELAYYSGSCILEIGVFGGRSAVVELRGAIAAWKDHAGPAPQYYGVDVAAQAFKRSWPVIEGAGVADHALLYHGDVTQLLRDIPITPTMVFVDGDHRHPGAWADLDVLTEHLAPGTPVFCHDYNNPKADVRAVVDEWVQRGFYESRGTFGASILLVTTDRCAGGAPTRLPDDVFASTARALRERYEQMLEGPMHVPVADITEPARIELKKSAPSANAV